VASWALSEAGRRETTLPVLGHGPASESALCLSCKVRSNERSRDKLCRVCRVDSHTRKWLWAGVFK
jgi:hypothetical protein